MKGHVVGESKHNGKAVMSVVQHILIGRSVGVDGLWPLVAAHAVSCWC